MPTALQVFQDSVFMPIATCKPPTNAPKVRYWTQIGFQLMCLPRLKEGEVPWRLFPWNGFIYNYSLAWREQFPVFVTPVFTHPDDALLFAGGQLECWDPFNGDRSSMIEQARKLCRALKYDMTTWYYKIYKNEYLWFASWVFSLWEGRMERV